MIRAFGCAIALFAGPVIPESSQHGDVMLLQTGLKPWNRKSELIATAATLADIKQTVMLEDPPATTIKTQSFGERMKEALTKFLLGLILLMFSVPVLWFNEQRSAQTESLLAWAKSQCRTVRADGVNEEQRHTLVHLLGEPMRAVAKVQDAEFNVHFAEGCIRLQKDVMVYQWVEETHEEEEEKFGGGKETVTTYTYSKKWSGAWNESGSFQDSKYRGLNTKPPGLNHLGVVTKTCDRVELGEAFLLSPELVDQCCDFVSATKVIGETVMLTSGGCTFAKIEEDAYFYSTAGGSLKQPEIGDARVSFKYVPDGPATVVALQAAANKETKESFLPYRLINRGWCGIPEHEEKRRLCDEGSKSSAQLAEEAGCDGMLGCICCACNLVMKCCAGVMTPEIHHLFHGNVSQPECFQKITDQNSTKTIVIRLVGWIMMFVGLYLLFSPFLTFIRIIPFLGPFLSNFGGGLIWFLCGITTFLLASAIIVVAYLFFHPMLGLLYAAIAAAVVAGTMFLFHHLTDPKVHQL